MSHIVSVTAITEVFGDGQKLTAAAVEYDMPVDGAALDALAFSVTGRTITAAYVSEAAARTRGAKSGNFVILDFSVDDQAAALFVHEGRSSRLLEARVEVAQVGEVTVVGEEKYEPDLQARPNGRVLNTLVDDFKQFEYKHAATGIVLKYNLFIPKHYDERKSYPLVTFVHDLGVSSTDPRMTLAQGLGALVWASPEEQAKHECFVLAPQYDVQIVNDDSEATDHLDATVDLIRYVATEYKLDTERLYGTGQSGGCMLFIAISIKYPELLAGSLLVAGQWDPALVAPLANDNLWIVVSEGDLKAFPGMNAITAALEEEGTKVSRATWSGRATAAEFAAGVERMLAEGNHIMYTVLRKGTVAAAGMEDDGGSNHVCTWRIAYQIEGIRDWLLRQTRSSV
jgi:predicted peptidase